MKAVIWTNYGPPEVLEIQEVEKPAPKNNEVLIKVHAATVFVGDCEIRSLKVSPLFRLPLRLFAGVRKPSRIQVLGQELAGEVEAVGKDVRNLKPGDAVFATTDMRMGAYAEFICLPSDSDEVALTLKPTNMTFGQAATVPVGGLEALHFIRQANLQGGHTILINGAGGSIGTMAIQMAKNLGAEVTAVDSAPKLDMLRSIGADHVIDYAQQDFTKSGAKYHVIFDVVGKSDYAASLACLSVNGRYLLANPSASVMFRALFHGGRDGKRVVIGAAPHRTQDLIALREMIQAGQLKTVIDRTYPLEQIVEAHRYVDSGQKKGNVVITVV